MPYPCPYDLAALARFLPDPQEFEDFVSLCTEMGEDVKAYVHDTLILAMDRDEVIDRQEFIRSVAEELIADRAAP